MKFTTAEELKGRNLIIEKRGEALDENGNVKGVFLDVQIDQSFMEPEQAQTDPHLASHVEKFKTENGENIRYLSHDIYYTKSQWDAMTSVEGNKWNHITHDGNEVIGLKANLMKNAKGAMIINTKSPMEPTENQEFNTTYTICDGPTEGFFTPDEVTFHDSDVLDRQLIITQEARSLAKSAKETPNTAKKDIEKGTPEAEVQEYSE